MKVLGFTLSLFLFLSLSFTALAQTTAELTPKTRLDARKDQLQEVRQKMQDRIDKVKEKREEKIAKLDAAKLKVCQTKEKVLGNRLGSLTKMSGNMLEKFDKIATRVKDFYTEKIIPAGGVVPNYDALVADIDTKKAAVDTALSSAKTNSEGFSCDADAPKEALSGFREDMQMVKSSLAEYRTSIKNLIVAVKGAAGVLKASPSPETE